MHLDKYAEQAILGPTTPSNICTTTTLHVHSPEIYF